MGTALIEYALTCRPEPAAIMVGLWLEGRTHRTVGTSADATIDLVAQGPVYRGHKLARIVEALASGRDGAYWDRTLNNFVQERKPSPPVSTKGWARLDVRVIGNPWGLSVSDVPVERQEWGIGPFGGGY